MVKVVVNMKMQVAVQVMVMVMAAHFFWQRDQYEVQEMEAMVKLKVR